MTAERTTDRRLFEIAGKDAEGFLQGLVTNDVKSANSGLVYAAVLTPQGKYLADFFLVRAGDVILLDVKDALADGLIRRLTMYKLRADVTISPSALHVLRGTGQCPEGAYSDPRCNALGWRKYSADAGGDPVTDWDALRVAHGIPETGIELIPDETYILEAGFERLHGVDFRKGCYVGQEVTARMKHKTELRKGFATVAISSPVPVGTEILREGKSVGQVFTQSGGRAIAYLRFDRAGDGMVAGDATVSDVTQP
jgi:hypothetical protein